MEIHENCPCKKKKCERHGRCDACRRHHAESKRQRPVACERGERWPEPAEGEAPYIKAAAGQMYTAREKSI